MYQLSKFLWQPLEQRQPYIKHLVSRINFTQDRYEDLLRSYVRHNDGNYMMLEDKVRATACDWVRDHEELWRAWMPEMKSHKTPIYLGGMFPMAGPRWREPGILPGKLGIYTL